MTDAPLEPGPREDRRIGSTRRSLLGVLAGLPLAISGPARRSLAASAQTSNGQTLPGQITSAANAGSPFPTDILATIAGPEGGATDRWARSVLSALAQALPPGARVRGVPTGAADGVTGANQFEARTAPDGSSLLVVPGAAALAWLVGDPRAQFDVGHWVPVMAGVCSGVVALRGGPAALAPGRKVRIATASLVGPELAALLGVDLLGAQPVPVAGLMDEASVRAALAKGSIDAALLRGPKLADEVAALSDLGMQPVFGLGILNEGGKAIRDPRFPDLPEFSELLMASRPQAAYGALFDGWQAIAAAARLEFAVVLPQLTPAAMVAKWRRIGSEAAAVLANPASDQVIRVHGGAPGAVEVSATVAESGTLLEIRRWLGKRLDWHPS